MVLKRRIGRVLRKNKAQYFGSMILVVLGSIVFMVFNTVSFNLKDNLKKFTDVSRLEDAKIVVREPIDIAELEGRYNITAEERKNIDYEIKKGVTIRLFEKTEKVNIPVKVAGKNLGSENEIIINPSFASAQKIKIGDKIKVFDEELTVAGFTSIPDYLYPTRLDSDLIADPKTFGIGVVEKSVLKDREGLKTYYCLKYAEGLPNGLKDYINDKYGLLMWQDTRDNARYNMVKGEIASLASMTLIIPVVVFILTCLLLAAVIWRMVKIEFVQIGTLYAIGYKRKEILIHYLSYPLLISLAGSILGTFLSFLIARPVLNFETYYYNLPIIEYYKGTKYLFPSILLPVLILVTGAVLIIWRGLKLTPLQLMRGYGENRKAGWLEKKLKLNSMGFVLKFKIREITRSVPRTIILIIGVAAASMLLLLGFTIRNTFNYAVDEGFRNTYKYNYSYTFMVPQIENKYDGDIYNAAPFKEAESGEDFIVYGISGSKRMIDLNDEKGKKLDYNKNIITKALAQRLNIKKGDTVSLKCKLNDRSYTVNIDEIAQVYTGNAIYMPLNEFNKMMGYDKNVFIGIFTSEKGNIDDRLLLKTESKEDLMTAMDSFLKPLKYMLLLIGVLAFLIALIVLYIIIALVIEENKTNISMLKVIGYSVKEIKNLVLNSGNIPVIIGYLISIPLLYTSLGAVMNSSLKEVDMVMPVRISAVSILAGFLIIYAAYELTKLISRKKIFSVPMSEILKAHRE